MERLTATVRHVLRLDEDLSEFYALAAADPDLAWAAKGAGRMVQSAHRFRGGRQDRLQRTNCTWSATERMVGALVEHLGERAPGGPPEGAHGRAFPTPQAMAAAPEDWYRDVARTGYRGAYLRSLATSVVDGRDPTSRGSARPRKDELPDDEVERRLLALPGVGPYAAAHVMMLIGRYSRLILDSWTRPKYAQADRRRRRRGQGDRRPLRALRQLRGPGLQALPHAGLGAVERSSLREGARRVAPLALPAAAFAVSFGVLAEAAGMGRLAPVVMSITTFAGSAQFAAASIVDEDGADRRGDRGGSVPEHAVRADRNLGGAALPRTDAGAECWRRSSLVDESWAISNRGGGRFDLGLLLGAGLYALPGMGAGDGRRRVVAGDLLGDPERLGLDAAFPALFLALLIPLLPTRASIAAALGGAAVALALVPIAPPGIPIDVAARGVRPSA